MLNEINTKPKVFSDYTAKSLWADEYRSTQMMKYHLLEDTDVSSRNIKFIDTSSSWIIHHFNLRPGVSVCDFGCGPGLYTSRLAISGAQITGLDFSENSIQYARQQAEVAGQNIKYVHADYLEFEPYDRFDLITMIMCDFCALSPAQRTSLLARVHGYLKPNGAFLLDVYSMDAFAEREEASFYEKNQLNHFWAREAYYCFVNIFKYDSESVVLDKYNIYTESGKHEVVYNWLQYFSTDSLTEELTMAGFTVTDIFQDVAGIPYSEHHPEFAVVATRSG